jgi:uncharacterized protein YjbI with pentapeptide repeats
VRVEEHPVEPKKPRRKAEPPSKRGIAWPRWTGLQGKTVWDVLQLLIVPLMLAAIGFWFTMQQDTRQQTIEDERAQAERELAMGRAQDEALQAYLDQMGNLLLEKDLRSSEEDSEVRTLARARTVTVIQRLDSDRNGNVIRFLDEAGLIGKEESSIRLLTGADLRGAHLQGIDMSGPDLSGPDLSGADLEGADLSGAALIEADLSRAHLNHTNLSDAELYNADLNHAFSDRVILREANLQGADLNFARITQEKLDEAQSLKGAIMPNGQKVLANGKLLPAEPLLLKRGRIEPDREYVTDEYAFEPTFRFEAPRVGEYHWQTWSRPETAEEIFIAEISPAGSFITFSRPHHVFDPSNPSEPKEVPAPQEVDEWVSWFQSHPNLDASMYPVPVMVGGEPGMQIDTTVSSKPKNYPQDLCDKPCVLLYPSGESSIGAFVGERDRFVIVDVGGEPVVINVDGRPGKLNEFIPDAQKVLDSVEWLENQ